MPRIVLSAGDITVNNTDMVPDFRWWQTKSQGALHIDFIKGEDVWRILGTKLL